MAPDDAKVKKKKGKGADKPPNDKPNRVDATEKKKKAKSTDKPTDEDPSGRMTKARGKEKQRGASDDVRRGTHKRSTNTEVVTDARFAAVHSDPRFRSIPSHKTKVAIDSRFSRMFHDKNFSSSSAPLDKRGKPKKGKDKNALLHYYQPEGEEKDEEEENEIEGLRRDGSGSSSSDSEAGLQEVDVSESDTSSTTSTDEDEDLDDLRKEGADDLNWERAEPNKEEVPLIEQETRRLAIVNMDWNHVKAADLYVLLSSFLPGGGNILSVAVYPSEFGLQRMEYEAVHGPADLFDGEESSDDDGEEIDNEKLREYERSRLRYFYAVVECDTCATADHLYKTCDGVEFERTSNVLDVRFIPDSMEFKHPPRDIATEAPTTYEGLNFQTKALQLSKVHLSWDDDEPERRKIMKRRFDSKQLDELEFKEFLASDEEESDEDEDDEATALPDGEKPQKANKRDLYLSLVQSQEGSDSETSNDKDMEITFNTGLEDISKKILEKKLNKKEETVWDAYLRKRSEKRKAKKKGSKFSSDDESGRSDVEANAQSDADDFFVEEPSDSDVKDDVVHNKKDTGKKAKGSKSKKDKKLSLDSDKEQEATTAELELLLADEGVDRGVKGYHIKAGKGKGKNRKEIMAEEKLPAMDFDDPRFSAVITSPLFALDPTDPQFKRSATYARQLLEKRKRAEGGMVKEQDSKPPEETQPRSASRMPENDKQLDSVTSSKKHKFELSSLVRSVKRKVGSLQS